MSDIINILHNVTNELEKDITNESVDIANKLKNEYEYFKTNIAKDLTTYSWKGVLNIDGSIDSSKYKSLYNRLMGKRFKINNFIKIGNKVTGEFETIGDEIINYGQKFIHNIKLDKDIVFKNKIMTYYYRLIQYDIINTLNEDKDLVINTFNDNLKRFNFIDDISYFTSNIIIDLKTKLKITDESDVIINIVTRAKNIGDFINAVDNEQLRPLASAVLQLINTVPNKLATFFNKSGIISILGKAIGQPKLFMVTGTILLGIFLATVFYEGEKQFNNIIKILFGVSINEEVIRDLKIIFKKIIKIFKFLKSKSKIIKYTK